MNLRFVEAFYWVASLRSVTRAAEKLFLTQSAMSSRVAALEEELGVLLLDRSDKRFKLTVKSVDRCYGSVDRCCSIDVTDQFEPRRPLKPMRSFPPSVRHVDTSGRPQFSVSEERVIGLNESRAVLKDFTANGGLDIVPVEFRKLAESLLCSYQRAITRKASVRAILCDRGYSAGALPTVLKPNVVRQENHQYTYNWFLVEYMTLPPSRQPSERIRRNSTAKRAERARSMQQEHEDSEDSGCLSSHSIEFGCL